ncbi:hypothetical protein AW736_11980 [Termitidicoccus mucosus]|uniref:DUF805 domain-containing protein n=1 Tax=Termitidicoccus mucosus TaxID=1184151 RepID=A0A178IIB5_9BACT|nr:hypothetical protein AW736_11980 [Opitutaceae bacterium TSB47]
MEKSDYRPEAVVLMLEELEKRGLSEQAISDVVKSTPPPLEGMLPERDTWLFPARLSRRRYAIRAVVFYVAVFATSLLLEFVPTLQPTSFIILVFASILYSALGLMLPRSKDAGLPSWIAIIFALFPITAFFTFVILFFIPPKKKEANHAPEPTRLTAGCSER